VTSRSALALAALTACLIVGPGAKPAAGQPVTRNLTLLSHPTDYAPPPGGQNYSACWSYIHSDGREYAIIGVNGSGTASGTAIYNVTVPAAPVLVGFILGPPSIWREMKSYRSWIYVVTEGEAAGFGLQVIRMTNPDSPVLATTYNTNFTHSHTVSIDTTRGILICNGTRNAAGLATGMRILALQNPGIGATPENPVEIAWWPGGAIPVNDNNYVHDSVPVGNRLFCASIYPGIQRVLDFTNPAAPTQIAAWSYPGGFTHNSWPDASGNFLYVTDEVKGQPLKVFNISNLNAPSLVNAITSNPQAIVHNAHVKGDELYLSNYTEGIRVLDLSDPAHPAEFAWADSYAGPSGGYSGVWAVCPFFPSGTVIASDRNSGLYVYGVVHNYGILRAHVTTGGFPFPGVEAHLTTLGDSLTTPADGVVQFAPGPGSHTVLAHAFGYYDASATRTVTNGSRDTVTLDLVPRPTGPFAGIVRDATTHAPINGAEVSLAYTGVHLHTGANGLYSLQVPDDMYRLEVRAAGHVPIELDRRIGPAFPGNDYELAPAPVWDPLEVAPGWTVGAAGDFAFSGIWTWVVPQGTGPRPSTEPEPEPPVAHSAPGQRVTPGPAGPTPGAGLTGARRPSGGLLPLSAQHEGEAPGALPNMAPYFDHTPGTGNRCFVTGNSADSVNIDDADVDGGKTSLTTPAMNLAAMAEPTIGYWRWFASYFPTGIGIGHNGPDINDYLAVLISNDNGTNWTPVDTTRGMLNEWEECAIRVADFVTPTTQVKLRFVATDGGNATTCEAGIDDLVAYDAAIPPVGVPDPVPPARLAFRAPVPNPAAGAVRLTLEVPAAGEVSVEVLDVSGRRVCTLHRGVAQAGSLPLVWDGRDASGRAAPAGLYFARAAAAGAHALARFARVR